MRAKTHHHITRRITQSHQIYVIFQAAACNLTLHYMHQLLYMPFNSYGKLLIRKLTRRFLDQLTRLRLHPRLIVRSYLQTYYQIRQDTKICSSYVSYSLLFFNPFFQPLFSFPSPRAIISKTPQTVQNIFYTYPSETFRRDKKYSKLIMEKEPV